MIKKILNLTCALLLAALMLWGIFGPHINWVTPRGRQAVTWADLHAFSEALKQFRVEGGAYPVTGPALTSFNSVIGSSLVERGYLRELPKEPWGGTFGYWSDGTHVVVASSGPNRRFDLEYGELVQEQLLTQPELLCGKMSPSNESVIV